MALTTQQGRSDHRAEPGGQGRQPLCLAVSSRGCPSHWRVHPLVAHNLTSPVPCACAILLVNADVIPTGVLHLGPDALEAQEAVGLDRFPLAAFLIVLAFFAVFFLHRTLAPALCLTTHLHSAYPGALVRLPHQEPSQQRTVAGVFCRGLS